MKTAAMSTQSSAAPSSITAIIQGPPITAMPLRRSMHLRASHRSAGRTMLVGIRSRLATTSTGMKGLRTNSAGEALTVKFESAGFRGM